MEVINKRCGNCGKYPFCKKTNGASDYCNEWIQRKIDIDSEVKEVNKVNTIIGQVMKKYQ